MERLDLCLEAGAELRCSQIRLLTSLLSCWPDIPLSLICFIKLSSIPHDVPGMPVKHLSLGTPGKEGSLSLSDSMQAPLVHAC